MTRIAWGDLQDRRYEYGIDRGVLYTAGNAGVAWNGLISVEEAPTGGDVTPYYFNGVKYLDVVSSEDFQATLTALSAPPQFNSCEGVKTLAAGLFATQQPRSVFSISYRTRIANAANPNFGYKLHLVYNCTVAPSGRTYSTKSDSVEPEQRSWDISSVPSDRGILPIKPTAHFVIDSTNSDPDGLALLEDVLYGTGISSSSIPTPTEINDLLS